MSFGQALLYFVREALRNLGRSLRVSLLAIVTIAVSLFVGGAFLLVGSNLEAAVEGWRAEARIVLYLEPAAAGAVSRLAAEAAAPAWVKAAEPVTPEAARARFRRSFPALGDLVEGWGEEPLPASIEVTLAPEVPGTELGGWLESWRGRPEVAMVDDDREWLRDLGAVVTVVRGIGITLAAVLLGAAIFTIASVIRLTVWLHGEEIAIMRLVGATEFFIRGPFWVEGLLQGLFGGGAAVAALWGVHRLVEARATDSLAASLAVGGFLSWRQVAFLVLLGGAAGLAGAIVSLRRETLGEE